MPIDGGLRDALEAGTILAARYKGGEYRAEVVKDAEGKTRYRLEDGREFKSPSAAGSAVMGGSCNGWRFWSIQTDTAPTDAKEVGVKARKPRKPKTAAEPVETTESEPSEAGEEAPIE
jgi:hypothetical protein